MAKKEEKRVEPIRLNYEGGEEYILEFNRETVVYAEDHGFDVNEVPNKMQKYMPDMFFYAFLMHHPKIDHETTDSILFDDLGGITPELTERLLGLYTKAYMTLINASGKPKNAKLTVSM